VSARNLVLSGGPLHPFAETSALVAETLNDVDVESTVTDDFDQSFALLVDPDEHWDLVTVNALAWTMPAERHAPLRAEWAFAVSDDRRDALAGHVHRGGGLLALHTAVICFDDWPGWRDIVGAVWDWSASGHPPPRAAAVSITAADHPVTAGLADFEVHDEIYGWLDEAPGLAPLATAHHGGRDHPVLWARTVGRGRVVTDTLGHGPESITHSTHAEILRRSARWVVDHDRERARAAH